MKKGLKILIVVLIILVILIGIGYYMFFYKSNKMNSGQGIFIENPMKVVLEKNNNDQTAAIQEGIKEFNENYINYILLALGIGNLHSMIGFGNPIIELSIDNEIWSSEIKDNSLITRLGANQNKDLIITMSREEAVKALLSSNIAQFMKDSVVNGNTRLEMVASKPALLAKGYLDLYNNLKG